MSMAQFAAQQVSQVHQHSYFPWSPRETPCQASVPSAKVDIPSRDSCGESIWSPSSWESQASFDMLADFLCFANDSPESSASEQTASCNLLQSPGLVIDSGRSSSDSDRSSLPESFRTASSSLPERSGFQLQLQQQSLPEPRNAYVSGTLSLRLNHDDVLSTWNKMSGGKAAFRNQQPSPASATVPAEMPNAFVPLVPQDCGKVCTRADQPVHQTLSSNEQLSNRTSIPSSAASLSTGFSNSLLSGSADPAELRAGSRQARLDRYREKKRTRGFSSRIRYEMRKINAERRPRVKGRFVKREDLSESLDEMLADFDPVDFGMITAMDISEDSFLL